MTYREMGMRPTIALMPSNRDVQKVPMIHKIVLYCIFLSLDRLLTVGVL